MIHRKVLVTGTTGSIGGMSSKGSRGMPPAGIGPDATLIFEVELLGIE
jgi:hypothetical protein